MKHIMKIRLRKDGTWENVYDDNSSDQEFTYLSNEMLIKMQAKKLSEIASDYLEQAVEASGYIDAKEVLAYIKNKT
jgi:hypothetical protein